MNKKDFMNTAFLTLNDIEYYFLNENASFKNVQKLYSDFCETQKQTERFLKYKEYQAKNIRQLSTIMEKL